MLTKNILVSGASGIVGYGILKSLKKEDCNLIGTTIYEVSPANCFSDIVLQPPLTSDPSYLKWLIQTIKTYNVDMIIPAIEADMDSWNENREVLDKTGTFVLLNNKELIRLCLDKWKFYQKLVENNYKGAIKTSISPNLNGFNFPILLKPRCSTGSKGIVKIETAEEFDKYKHSIGNHLMVQEIVGNNDEEYTSSAFFNENSELLAYMCLKRKLSKQGFTEIAQVENPTGLLDEILKLAAIFKPVGPTNFQFRKHNGNWKILEINPRISSSSSIRAAFGYNESKMAVDYFLNGQQISQPKIKGGKAIRYTEDFIFCDKRFVPFVTKQKTY